MSELLAARGVTVRLGGKPVVRDASLTLRAGELVALVGPNGAGKTTLMRALTGLVSADGAVTLGGAALGSLKARERARRVAYLPQGHVFHWPMAVAEIIALGREPHADPFSGTTDVDRAAVALAMKTTETESFAARDVTTLSGGERARVALARALVTEAPVLLADEATASLDPRHQFVVMELLRNEAHAGNAVLATMHDLTLAARFADRVLMMHEGRIVADGAPGDVLSADRLRDVFGITATTVVVDGKSVPIATRPSQPFP